MALADVGGRALSLRSLLLLLVCSSACLAQRNDESRPAPLDPVQGAREARAFVADMLDQTPDQNTTNTGSVKVRDAAGKEREIPAQFEIYSTPTNWVSTYETRLSPGSSEGAKLTVVHAGGRPSRYELSDPGAPSGTNATIKVLTPDQLMVPFAGSDFWIADLGLEFLHWPRQRVLTHEMRHSKSCKKLESLNPHPVPGGYARVVSWVMTERPHGILHADAYDADGKLLKSFDPTNVEKIQGEYQLDEMVMKNRKTGSQTLIKFNLTGQSARSAN